MTSYDLSKRYEARDRAREKKQTAKSQSKTKYGMIKPDSANPALRPIYRIQERRLNHFNGDVPGLILLYLRDRSNAQNSHSAQ